MVALQIAMGALLGWVLCPRAWPLALVGYPIRWMLLVVWNAWHESRLEPAAIGDQGRSIGVLQFFAPTAAELMGRPSLASWLIRRRFGAGDLNWRYSPFWSGVAASAFLGSALAADSTWYWRLALPGYDGAAIRYMWTHGADSADEAAGPEAAAYVTPEGWRLYLLSVVVGLMLVGIVATVRRWAWWTAKTAMAVFVVSFLLVARINIQRGRGV